MKDLPTEKEEKEYLMEFYEKPENKRKILNRKKEWLRKRRKTIAMAVARYEARKVGLESTLTEKQWEYAILYFSNRCAYCRKIPKRIMHKEHYIAASIGGTFTSHNIVPSCGRCNSSKCSADVWVWLCNRFGKKCAIKINIKIMEFFQTV